MKKISDFILRGMQTVLSRNALENFNQALFRLSTIGLGVGLYDPRQLDEQNFLRRHIKKPEAVVLDVGANRGQYAAMARAVLPAAKIFSFEPHPISFAKLSELAKSLNFVAIHAAVGDRMADVELFDYESDEGSEHASLVPGVIEKIHGSKSSRHLVQMITVDEFVEKQQLCFIDLLKIDVEGAELDVLHGAATTIRENRLGAIQIEFNEMNTLSRTFVRDFMELMPSLRIYRLLQNGDLHMISDKFALYRELFGYQNLVALPHL